MQQDHAQNAMTEIALALAMGFFAIMVLALVSMGSQQIFSHTENKQADIKNPLDLIKNDGQKQDKSAPMQDEDLFIIHHQGAFYDHDLQPIFIATIEPMQNQRIILALSPTLSMREASDIKAEFTHINLQITLLDNAWEKALRSISHE